MAEDDRIQNMYPLSPMQSGMLYHALRDKKSHAYFEQCLFTIAGEIDYTLLEKSFKLLVKKYDIFRTVFRFKKVKKPFQIVLKTRDTQLYYEDAAHLNKEETAKYIEEFKRKDKERGFDLSRDLLIRLALLKTAAQTYRLVFSFHHIVMDGWCLSIVFNELIRMYNSLGQGRPIALGEPIPYITYIRWLEKQDKGAGLAEWREYLAGYRRTARVPVSAPPVHGVKYKLEELDLVIDGAPAAALHRAARENQVTINTVFQTLWGILLQQYNNCGDVVFGAVVSGRPAEIEGIEDMVGLFINTVPVRIKTNENQEFTTLLKRVQKESGALKKYEFLPLAEIQANSPLKRNLIDHILVFENFPIQEAVHVKTTGENHDRARAPRFDILNVEVHEQTNYHFNMVVSPGQNIMVKFSYNASVYGKDWIRTISSHIKKVAKDVTDNPAVKINQVEILTEEEKEQILVDFNRTAAPYPRDKTIHALFEEQAAREGVGGRVALTEGPSALTYDELNKKAHRLAYLLMEKGVKTDTIVGIMLERSIELIVGILAVLKAGGAYLPIDPGYPEERKQYMLEDSGATLLSRLLASPKHTLSHLRPAPRAPRLAYVIYTSGSTGKPKGVMIEHRGLVNYIWWAVKYYLKDGRLSPAGFPLYTSISFDLTVTSIFMPLITANNIIIYGGGDRESPLGKIIEDNRAALIKLTPTHLKLIGDKKTGAGTGALRGIKSIIVGGEELETRSARDIYAYFDENVEIYNEYGPTEAVVGCMIYKFNPGRDNRPTVPIGCPVANVKIYILNRHGKAVPAGIAGEIHISGHGLARGYLNRPALTGEKFLTNPYQPGKRMYATGDLARRLPLPAGDIEFLGRIDSQVKVRGHRVELAEIEHTLSRHEEIKEALVTVENNDNPEGENRLCAYIIAHRQLSASRLRQYLSVSLPGYMIPAYFVQLDKIPLTVNGKVDRKALPPPGAAIGSGECEYVPPRDEMEEKLVEIWSELLGIKKEKIGIEHNFFDMGGHSLNAIMLVSRVHKEFGIEMPVTQIFEAPTVKEVANRINSRQYTEEDVILLNRPAPKKLFCFPPAVALGVAYKGLAAAVPGYSLYSFNFIEDEQRLNKYRDIITGLQPHGPYILFGWSAAGKLIFQLTKNLEDHGHHVSDIILVDSFPTGDEGDETGEEGTAAFNRIVAEHLENWGLSFLKDRVIKKSQKYLGYIHGIDRLEMIDANVHLLLSEENQTGDKIKTWEDFTTKKVMHYNGFGNHEVMLYPGFLEKNAALTREILAQIEII